MRLRIKLERVDGGASTTLIALANSGFVGEAPEVLVPGHVAKEL